MEWGRWLRGKVELGGMGWGGREDQGMVKGMTREDERKEKK